MIVIPPDVRSGFVRYNSFTHNNICRSNDFCARFLPGALPLAELNMAFSHKGQDILIYIPLIEQFFSLKGLLISARGKRGTSATPG
jgi:hypothetical protein